MQLLKTLDNRFDSLSLKTKLELFLLPLLLVYLIIYLFPPSSNIYIEKVYKSKAIVRKMDESYINILKKIHNIV